MRRDGYDALTMRRLASELGTGQASLYAHVANKSALDQAIITTVLLGIPAVDRSPDRWREALIDTATQLYQAIVDHPGIAPAHFGSGLSDPLLLGREEALLAVLRAAGLTMTEALAGVIGTTLLALARAQEETVIQQRIDEAKIPKSEWYAEMRSAMRSTLPKEEFPLLNETIEMVYPAHRTKVFNGMLELLADGLAARIQLRTH